MRAIDGDHLKKWIISRGLEYSKKGYNLTAVEILDQIDREPSAQPERKKGKWINISISVSGDSSAECNRCGAIVHNSFADTINFCPNCGSDNRGE